MASPQTLVEKIASVHTGGHAGGARPVYCGQIATLRRRHLMTSTVAPELIVAGGAEEVVRRRPGGAAS